MAPLSSTTHMSAILQQQQQHNEMFVPETCGRLMLNEKWKYGYDHVKCTFGAMTIFNAAFKKYFFATKETAIRLQIPYLHTMGR